MNFDHILLLGYGAPEKAEDVMPYLRSMSDGRGIPEDRLNALAKHYELIGGASPYNAQVLDFKERLGKELHAVGINVPVFTGMKNWHPFLKEVLLEIHQKGLRKGLVIPLTPYRSASSGARYKESLECLCSASGMNDLYYQFIEGWYDQELFIQAEAEEVSRVLQTVASEERSETPILFSFHSLPLHRDPANPISHYSEEARAASALVAERLGHSKWTVVYQSRPVSACEDWPSRPGEGAGIVGIPAKTAWVSPEIGEEVKALAARGEKKVLVVPLGFLCDHAEILYDLDHAARGVIEKAGMEYLRAKTVLHHPKITTLFRTLIEKSNP